MTVQADAYRLRAAELHVKAERNEVFRKEFEDLVFLYLRLAEQADRDERQPNAIDHHRERMVREA
jgi:hypothetical protein